MPPPLLRIPQMPSRFSDPNESARDFGTTAPPAGLAAWAIDGAGDPRVPDTVPSAPPPVSYANEPQLSHGSQGVDPSVLPRPMPAPRLFGTLPPHPVAPAAMPESAPPRAPRLLRRPAQATGTAAPEVDSAGRPLAPDFIDAMTASPAPMYVEPQETAYDRERRAIESARSLEVQRGEMLARQAAERIDAEEAARRRADQLEVDRREAEGRAREAMQRSVDRLAEMRVEPSRYWRDAGAFGIIGNALAVGLGSIGEALGGGPERTVSTINASIDRDIRAQEQDIATAGADVENRRGILAEVQREYQSREAAMEATRAIMLREAAAQAEMQAAQQGTAEVNANAARARDQLFTQAEQAQAAAERAEVTDALELREQRARIRGLEARALREERRAMGGGTARPTRATVAELETYDNLLSRDEAPDVASRMAGLPPGFTPSANPSADQTRQTLDFLDADLRVIESMMDRAGPSGDVPGVGTFDQMIPAWATSGDALTMRNALTRLSEGYGRLHSQGAISDQEIELFNNIINGSGTEEELRIGLAAVRREVDARMRRGARAGSGGDIIDQAAAGMTQVE